MKVYWRTVQAGVFLLAFLVMAGGVEAATLQFSPATGSHATNEAFGVEIKVDTKNVDVTSTDAVIIFDKTLLSIDNVTYGSFFPTVLHSEQNGKLYISGMVDSAGSVKTGTGTLATVTFKGLTAGTATLSFECEAGRTDDSNVSKNDLDSTDIIECTALTNATFTLTGASVNPTTPPSDGGNTGNTGNTGSTGNTGTLPQTSSGTGGAVGATEIPNTGFADVVKLLPKILMGILFIVAGIIPLVI